MLVQVSNSAFLLGFMMMGCPYDGNDSNLPLKWVSLSLYLLQSRNSYKVIVQLCYILLEPIQGRHPHTHSS